MKNYTTGLWLLGMALVITSCSAPCVEGTGDLTKEKRKIEAFTEIDLQIDGEVELAYSPATRIYSVLIEAQENLLPYISTKVEGNKLIIKSDQCLNTLEPITFFIPITKMSSVVNQGSGRIFSASHFPYDKLEAVNEGSGILDLAVKGEELEVYNYGSGTVAISGFTVGLTCLNRGSGDVQLSELTTNEANVKNQGSGNVTFKAEESLIIKNEGSGNVGYDGYPESMDTKNEGSGSIYRIGE